MPFVINVFRFLDHAAFLHHPLRTSISRGFNTMNGAADSSSPHIGNLPRKPHVHTQLSTDTRPFSAPVRV
jgi:hypothetical protein